MSEAYGKRPMWQWVMIYVVVGGLLYWLVYYFILSRNGGNNQLYRAPESDITTPSSDEGPVNSAVIRLDEENASGQSGTAVLEELDGKVTVTVNLTGSSGATPQPAHLHDGACPGVGAVKYPLSNVINGTSVTTLDVSLGTLKSQLPLALNVHKSAAEAKVYTACGPLAF